MSIEVSKMSDQVSRTSLQFIIDTLSDIACNGDQKGFNVKDSTNLVRRLKLFSPLFEELSEIEGPLPGKVSPFLEVFRKALHSAERILHQCRNGSKLLLVLHRDEIAGKFHEVTTQLQEALDYLPYDQLDLSDEVREQVELVHEQLKRAKCRLETPELELYLDALTILSQKDEVMVNSKVLRRFAEKMHISTASDLKQESLALQSVMMGKGAKNDELIEQVMFILAMVETVVMDSKESCNLYIKTDKISTAVTEKPNVPNIPNDFRCPISLELMKDPVIVASGQTYERRSIQKWLDAGCRTCPKTQQVLPHLMLTPNYVLKSLIEQWCGTHGIESPNTTSHVGKVCELAPQISPGDKATIERLLQDLSSRQIDVQRTAAGELRSLAKRSTENRISIAKAGAIPLLVSLLTSSDMPTQEHAVTALLNLSIHQQNKSSIVGAGAIPPIVDVLKKGSMVARENAAATLFSLSVIDAHKAVIGASGAIPALVELLSHGTNRGKKDAATALFNLAICQGNKYRAVKAGVIPLLMQMLVDSTAGMVDEALAILAILATHQEGRIAISSTSPVPVLVHFIRLGSPRNKENAAAILLAISTHNSAHVLAACQLGAFLPLTELLSNGTARAKRKAKALLKEMTSTGTCG